MVKALRARKSQVVVGTCPDLGALTAVVGPIFLSRPDEMFSVDRFDPSGAGYRRTARALLPACWSVWVSRPTCRPGTTHRSKPCLAGAGEAWAWSR
ncbi:MAG: hypothetical protein ABIQ59_18265 [Nocardioidaceae bacterium]